MATGDSFGVSCGELRRASRLNAVVALRSRCVLDRSGNPTQSFDLRVVSRELLNLVLLRSERIRLAAVC